MSHEQYQSVIESLHECMVACNHCFDACLEEENVRMMSKCIRLDRECADICSYLEQAIARGTPFISELAQVCATICEECGKECQNHQHPHCQNCAEACLRCAEACRKLTA
ncbi:four-helix bundle copper-binding protein [Neobacillus drentensis]|uniref:four-helix bundle copper-binding protein n=1 Tax=Neobacillus drentensis TaxID=220684 RepID=UPI001F230D5E|nr:four-helix bundle copper-binding protein [Neobacillus drentensis]ULT54955.1 four-helix bundle copper-binding protein [Neobacillus drentensis]